jgi:hypothetical protein
MMSKLMVAGSTEISSGPEVGSRFVCFRWLNVVAIGLMPLMNTGCGESRVPVFPVVGQVTYEGEPTVGAQVVFHPVGHKLPEDEAAIASVKEDGSFDASIYGNGGIPAGEYAVTIQWRKLVETEGGFGTGPDVLPEQYSKADTTPIKVTVKEETNVLDPIVIE